MKTTDTDIIARGLSDASEELLRSETVKKGYIKELARLALIDEGDSVGELFSADGYGGAALSSSLKAAIGLVGNGASGGIFARFLTDVYEKRFGEVKDSLLFPEYDSVPASASFVSGSGADAAFEAFARHFHLSAVHTSRISSACDAVLDGDAGYCILPIVSGTDGRLRSFYRMIDVYGLKISATVTVESVENVMRYALCKRNSHPISPSPSRIELSVPCDGATALSLAKAAEALGHGLCEVSSAPSERNGEIFSFTFILGGSFKSFILYLNLFHPRFTLTGIYDAVTE